MAHKKLYRSRTDRVLAGVCAGIGDYLDTDPTVVRVVAALIVLFTGLLPGLLAYLVLALVIPTRN